MKIILINVCSVERLLYRKEAAEKRVNGGINKNGIHRSDERPITWERIC